MIKFFSPSFIDLESKKSTEQQLVSLYKILPQDRYYSFKNDALSGYCLMKSGVPQDSVLGPFLYPLYTYDLSETHTSTITGFVDDVAILCTNNDPVVIIVPVKTDIKYLGLNLNPKLTYNKHIQINKRQLEIKLKQMK